jgi:pilus assembly protein Flp/PilA
MNNLIAKFWRDETGLSAVEYAVAGGLVILGLVAAFTLLGENTATRIDDLAGAVSGGP